MWSATAGTASAEEPWLLTLEVDGMLPVSTPQRDWFGPGGSGAVGAYRSLTENIAVGLRLRGGILSDGDSPEDPALADPSYGSLVTLGVAGRFRLDSPAERPKSRAIGPFLDVSVGAALTGTELRPQAEAGFGWGFEVGPVVLAPTVRYGHVLETTSALDRSDAMLIMAGVELVLLDDVSPPPPPPPPPDSDGDGLYDDEDGCPMDAEDVDGFQDEDGCPEVDNDSDGIVDANDRCPNEPEDVDSFEDEDGCPDTDNDGDGLLDADDQCPNEPETVNGNDDHDGCPDEGVIEFVNDRIVLEERVIFETNRARVRSGAQSIVDAIYKLWQLHPEWQKVRIEGHADQRGSDEYNLHLSQRRARNVVRALVKRGMPAHMFVAEGYGRTRPRVEGTTAEAFRANRRVEFVVLSRHPVGADGQPVRVGPDGQPHPIEPTDAASNADEGDASSDFDPQSEEEEKR